MLKALYDYANAHELTVPDGYVKKTVKAYISLSSKNREHIEIIMGDDTGIPFPDIGSLANGTDKSNVLLEKRSVVVPDAETNKSRFFLDALRSLGSQDERVRLCAEALEDDTMLQRIREKLDAEKIKAGDRISFKVDNEPIIELPSVLPWWRGFRKQFQSSDGERVPCLITGEMTVPVATVPPINGLYAVGGHSRGDALICFDKPAFCSYELKQSANAPVSESAINAVKVALDQLLSKAPSLAGMKFVHWYDHDIPREDDPLVGTGLFGDMDDMFEEDEDEEIDEETCDVDVDRIETEAVNAADHVLDSVETGAEALPLDASYHILLLTGVNGRVMVRRYERGRYEQLQKNIKLWNDDLKLVNGAETALLKSCKLNARLVRLLKYRKRDTMKLYKRLEKELSGIFPTVIFAILNGSRLPDAVAVRSLAYIRSKLLSAGGDNDTAKGPENGLDGYACQWLKVWLIRREREEHTEGEEMLMEEYNMTHSEAAYHCGGMMAVYAAIQNAGYENVNVNVVQRYYASAIQMPALVFGRLSQLCVHHMEKIEYNKLAVLYTEMLEKLNVALGDTIPATLDLEKQAYFALGYYQMSARLRRERRELWNRGDSSRIGTDEDNTEE